MLEAAGVWWAARRPNRGPSSEPGMSGSDSPGWARVAWGTRPNPPVRTEFGLGSDQVRTRFGRKHPDSNALGFPE